jgi:1,2-diacylglycerol 3-alpha-glucosyltransferase
MDGVVSSTLSFRKELQRRGHRVYIFASGTEKTKKEIEAKYDDVHIFRSIKFAKYPQYNVALFPFASSLKAKDIDIIHAQTPFMMGNAGMFSARINRVPIVSTFHTLVTDKSVIGQYVTSSKLGQTILSKYAWDFARFFYNRCDAVVSPSEAIERVLEDNRIERVRTVPNGIDTKKFNPSNKGDKIRSRLGIRDDEKMILYLGRISSEKKLEVMIKAAKTLQKGEKVQFVISGTGPALQHYKSLVQKAGLSRIFTFTGFVGGDEIQSYYAASDVFCIPSTFETQGMVALEAMATGKPVVAADRLALSDLVKNGQNGEKFAPGDWRGCARKIEKVINNMGSYKDMVPTARKYSIESTTSELLDLYSGLLDTGIK